MKITDKILDPYYIEVDSFGFTVRENTGRVVKSGKNKGESITYTVGHYSSLKYAVERVAKEKSIVDGQTTLLDYIQKYESIKNEILEAIGI